MRLGSFSDTGHTRVVEDSVERIRPEQNTGLTWHDGELGLGTETGITEVENNGS